MTSDVNIRLSPHDPPELPPIEHVTVSSDEQPDECTLFPRDAPEETLVTTWISALEGSYVDCESVR